MSDGQLSHAEDRLVVLKGQIRHRLQPVCSQMPSEEFEGLVAQIAAVETGWLNNPPLWPDREIGDSKP